MNPIVLLAGAGLASLLLFGKKSAAEGAVRTQGPSGYVWRVLNTHTTVPAQGRPTPMTRFEVYTDPESLGVKEPTLVVAFATDGTSDYVLERNPTIPQALQDAATSDFQLIPYTA